MVLNLVRQNRPLVCKRFPRQHPHIRTVVYHATVCFRCANIISAHEVLEFKTGNSKECGEYIPDNEIHTEIVVITKRKKDNAKESQCYDAARRKQYYYRPAKF